MSKNQENFFVQIKTSLTRWSALPGDCYKLLGVLLSYAGPDDSCFPSQALLAKDMGLSIRTIGKLLKKLAALGCIAIQRRGLTMSNKYFILVKVESVDKPSTQETQPGASPEKHTVANELYTPNNKVINRAERRFIKQKKNPVDFTKYTGSGKFAFLFEN